MGHRQDEGRGLENVRAEEYTSRAIWLPGVDLGEVTFPRAESLRVAVMPFSAATAPGGLEAEVIDVSAGDEESFAALGARMKGRWVLTHTEPKVNLRELKANTAIAAVLMFGLANSAKAPAPRQSRSEIEALVARTGLDQQMKTFGLWDEFVSGERGRPPQK